MHVILAVAALGSLGLATTALAAPLTVATAPAPANSTKVCAVYAPGNWRTLTPVPGNWSIDDCRNAGKEVRAESLQIACFWTTELPGGVAKFSFGKPSGINDAPTTDLLPARNCGW
jgi:hypothetical protein